MNNRVHKTEYNIVNWEIVSPEDFVIEVEIETITANKPTTQNRYRLAVGVLRESLKGKHIGKLLCEYMDIRSSKEEKVVKQSLMDQKDAVERFWTERIFCNPWIDAGGDMRFLNGACFSASWIVQVGKLVD